ncbi:hypothetical protein [Leptothoe sp. PORK10 BA2]|uniref:hypothetical protein n=1 Tax=Leptothoe sp. PORK10 BA2 TaxID=3110254 RepID=UPI002B1FE9E6|nr:hypothetical protein [Leptothoe sp. PORK10 BA2]MEA5464653.1 hypothetical protein [Leptothoe sp. PORK10 BA2]
MLEHETAKLAELQRDHTAMVRDYQLALGKRSTAEYEHSRALAADVSSRGHAQLSYQQQWANYEQRLRDRDFQLAQTQLRVDEVENAIATLELEAANLLRRREEVAEALTREVVDLVLDYEELRRMLKVV